MTITFESGEGSLEVEPDSPSKEDHSAFLADLLTKGGLQFPAQQSPETVVAASDISHERVEQLMAHASTMAIVATEAA